mmetsp:Transcript_39639/g.88823  ORF Transcript_39639/g.88823 Transcript_39639/m.88823 type:complete len:216 (+) Transcript_39639:362-1009(+)
MLMVLVILEEISISLKHAVEREALDANDLLEWDFGVLRIDDWCQTVDAPNLIRECLEIALRAHEVRFVHDDAVCKSYLLDGFVLNPFRLLLSKVLQGVLRVDHGDNTIQQHLRLDHVVGEEGLRHRRWVRKPRGLDQHPIELGTLQGSFLEDAPQPLDQVTAHSAANAAIVHLNDLLGAQIFSPSNELVIDAYLAKLILDDCVALPMRFTEDVIQ